MTQWMLIAQAANQPSAGWSFLLQMALIGLVFYFIAIRPSLKKQKELQEQIETLQKGDKVITTGGIYGEVAKTEGDTVLLKLAENVKVKVAKRAIGGLAGTPKENGGK